MNKTRLIWGIICLVISAVLIVLSITLPKDQMVFMVGNRNMPVLPGIILGIVGIVLLATAARGGEAEAALADAPEPTGKPVADPEKTALNKRLESIAWGCFFIMLGGFIFLPDEVVDHGLWSIGVGLIMLGLNAARYYYKIRMSGFTTVLGILALIGGVLELAGVSNLEGGILLIVLGAYLLLKPYFDRRQLFGKAEQA